MTSALEIYRLLPKENCERCGLATCMDLAIKLSEGEKSIGDCPLLSEEMSGSLSRLLAPRVAEVGVSGLRLGGEYVMYRHERRFMNPTLFFLDVSDEMPEEEVGRRIAFASKKVVERIGRDYRMDGLALRSSSGDPERFRDLVKHVSKAYRGPLMLCSFDPAVLEAGLSEAKAEVILYAADRGNLEEMKKLAGERHALVLSDPGLEGCEKSILDLGLSDGLGKSLRKYTDNRKKAVAEGNGLPLMASLVSAAENGFSEASLAALLMNRYCSLIVFHTPEPWVFLPLFTLRENIYSDPRVEPTVEPGVYEIGEPDIYSPVILTTNFALTYSSVASDLEKDNVASYILVVDTEGLAATVAVAADKITVESIKSAIWSTDLGAKVNHRRMIIPGVLSRLKADIEKETGWTALVGPQDSSQLSEYLEREWNIK